MDSDGASRPGGRPARLRPSSASGDGALGGGGHTGANDGIGDLGGVGAGENDADGEHFKLKFLFAIFRVGTRRMSFPDLLLREADKE